MDLISKDKLKELAQHYDEPAISIYMPTHRAGDEVQQDPIRIRNMMKEAEDQLRKKGHKDQQINKLLQPVNELLSDTDYMKYLSDGLAMFVSPSHHSFHRLPLDFEEEVLTGSSFYLKPMMPLLTGNGSFYILALSQNQIRLLHATRETVNEIELEGISESLDDFLGIEVYHEGLQHHVANKRGQTGQQDAMFHGHGDTEDKNDQLFRYFRQVDKAVSKSIKPDNAPLVLAGVEYLHPIYREANTYSHILNAGVEGNTDHWRLDELHRSAWECVEPLFSKKKQEALAKYAELNGTGKATDKINKIWMASLERRIESLFITGNRKQWGKTPGQNGSLELHAARQKDSIEIIDRIAVDTIRNNGKVFSVTPDEMPTGDVAAAVFRY